MDGQINFEHDPNRTFSAAISNTKIKTYSKTFIDDIVKKPFPDGVTTIYVQAVANKALQAMDTTHKISGQYTIDTSFPCMTFRSEETAGAKTAGFDPSPVYIWRNTKSRTIFVPTENAIYFLTKDGQTPKSLDLFQINITKEGFEGKLKNDKGGDIFDHTTINGKQSEFGKDTQLWVGQYPVPATHFTKAANLITTPVLKKDTYYLYLKSKGVVDYEKCIGFYKSSIKPANTHDETFNTTQWVNIDVRKHEQGICQLQEKDQTPIMWLR